MRIGAAASIAAILALCLCSMCKASSSNNGQTDKHDRKHSAEWHDNQCHLKSFYKCLVSATAQAQDPKPYYQCMLNVGCAEPPNQTTTTSPSGNNVSLKTIKQIELCVKPIFVKAKHDIETCMFNRIGGFKFWAGLQGTINAQPFPDFGQLIILVCGKRKRTAALTCFDTVKAQACQNRTACITALSPDCQPYIQRVKTEVCWCAGQTIFPPTGVPSVPEVIGQRCGGVQQALIDRQVLLQRFCDSVQPC